jgi:hypothetical protein
MESQGSDIWEEEIDEGFKFRIGEGGGGELP